MVGEKAKATVIRCVSCGGNIQWRAPGFSITLACEKCGALVDVARPEAQILLQAQEKTNIKPLLPLGSRGKWRGETYEVIGFLRRTDGSGEYEWDEYLLFNPYKGYRWLVQSEGNWNDVVPLREKPQIRGDEAFLSGKAYNLNIEGEAVVANVLGEFYWRVKVGDRVQVKDFVQPPEMLSLEKDASEEIWSLGTYVEAQEIAQAWSLKDPLPAKIGVAPNQPPPPKKRGVMIAAWALTILAVLVYFMSNIEPSPPFFQTSVNAITLPAGKYQVQGTFIIDDKPGDLDLIIKSAAPPQYELVMLGIKLTNTATGENRAVSLEAPWAGGSTETEISALPAGNYQFSIDQTQNQNVLKNEYTVQLERKAGQSSNLITAILGLWIYPLWVRFRNWSQNTARWISSAGEEE